MALGFTYLPGEEALCQRGGSTSAVLLRGMLVEELLAANERIYATG